MKFLLSLQAMLARRHQSPRPRGATSSGRSAGRLARLALVRAPPVAGAEVAERHPERAVLHLPDVAELVRDQAVVDVGAAEEDHEVRREPVEAAPGAETEEPRRDDDPDVLDPHRARPPVEPVEALLCPDE